MNFIQINSRESAAIASFCFGIFNLSAVSGILERWLSDGLVDVLGFFFMFSVVFGLILGKYGLNSKRADIAAAGFLMSLVALGYIIWLALQTRN
jgi:hypothetical protein